MRYHVMTLFPELIEKGMHTGVLYRAMEEGVLSLDTYHIREHTANKHKRVDDYTYGGGAGMLIQAQPVYDTYLAVCEAIGAEAGRPAADPLTIAASLAGAPQAQEAGRKRPRVIYATPQGQVFTQALAEELAKEEELVFLCGHYEGVDERVLEAIVTDYVSIGDYVLTGGELPALVMMDAISRLIPGVLNNDESAMTESFTDGLLEYPQYTRPEVWEGRAVPEVLLSGHHARVEEWRLAQSLERTRQRRPDLYDAYIKAHPPQETPAGNKNKRGIGRQTAGHAVPEDAALVVDGLCKQFRRLVMEEASDERAGGRGTDVPDVTTPKRRYGAGKRQSRQETFYAVDHVSLYARRGEILGILGPNGAGKTTLLRMIGQLMRPDAGSVQVRTAIVDGSARAGEGVLDGQVSLKGQRGTAGHSDAAQAVENKRRIGYLSENTHLYGRLSTREMLRTIAEIHGIPRTACDARIEEICEVLQMGDFIDNRIERLSTGQTQRANIARCLIHRPEIYVFDEPTLGLDILSSESIIAFMRGERDRGRCVIYSTHYMEEAQYLCDRILMLHQGRIIAQGTPGELMAATGTDNLREAFRAAIARYTDGGVASGDDARA